MMAYVLAAGKIHGDDTPVTLLTPGASGGASGTSTAHFWVYLRDDRSSGDGAPPAVVYRFSADRRGAHPAAHLRDYAGYFQADAFSGYKRSTTTGLPARRAASSRSAAGAMFAASSTTCW